MKAKVSARAFWAARAAEAKAERQSKQRALREQQKLLGTGRVWSRKWPEMRLEEGQRLHHGGLLRAL